METSQKNNYKNEHIASKKALSFTGIVTLIVAAVSFYAGSLFGENSVYKNLHGGKSVLPQRNRNKVAI